MNSSYAITKKLSLFGNSSPLHGIQTERGLDNSFRNIFISSSSEDYRSRIFSGYRMFSNTMAGFNKTYIESISRELISPFISFDYDESLKKILKKETEYEINVSLNMTRDLLKRIFPSVGSISVALDKKGESNSSIYPGIHFAFDFHYSNSDFIDPLSFSISNGTISFVGGRDVSVVMFVPMLYISNVIRDSFSVVAQESKIPVKSVVPSSAFQKARETVSEDILISIMENIYADRQREFIFSQMRTLFFISGNIANVLPADGEIGSRQPISDARRKLLKDIAEPILKTKFDIKDLSYTPNPDFGKFLYKTYSPDYTNINPYQLEKWLFPISYIETNAMAEKISFLKNLSNGEKIFKDYLTTQEYLEHTFGDDVGDMLALAIKIKRFMPSLLLSVFIYGGGNKIGFFERFLMILKDTIRTLENYTNISMNTRSLKMFVGSIFDSILTGNGDLSSARIGESTYGVVSIIGTFLD